MTKSIPLTQGKFAIVDDEDFEELNKYKWYFYHGYAARTLWPSRKNIYMHRNIIYVDSGMEIDHKNGNKLDNRRLNLRIATHSQNSKNQRIPKNNTSGFKGVTLNKRDGNWTSQIKVDGKHIFLGNYVLAEDAALAYDKAACKYFGKFANVNFQKG